MTDKPDLVVISGTSRGIGAALARRYLAEGRDVIGIARSAGELSGEPRFTFVQADLSTAGEVARVADAIRATGRKITVLVNNAGVQESIDLTADDDSGPAGRIEREIGINLTAPILLAQALIPIMRRPGGTIVNVTSLLARHPKPNAPVYCAAKAGLESFTRSLRMQVEPLGIAVLDAVPPLVDTQMTAGRGSGKISPEEMAAAIVAAVEKGKKVAPAGIARPMLAVNRLVPGIVARIMAKT